MNLNVAGVGWKFSIHPERRATLCHVPWLSVQLTLTVEQHFDILAHHTVEDLQLELDLAWSMRRGWRMR